MDDSTQSKESVGPSSSAGKAKRKPSGKETSEDSHAEQSATKRARRSEASSGDRQSRKVERPKKPLSAYNLFFSNERKKIMQSGESLSDVYEREVKPDTTVQAPLDNFQCLVKIVSKRWKNITKKERDKYEAMARKESRAYDEKMEDYLKYEEEVKEAEQNRAEDMGASKRQALSQSTPGVSSQQRLSASYETEPSATANFANQIDGRSLPSALVTYLQAASWEKLVQILAFIMVLESSSQTASSSVTAPANVAAAESNPIQQMISQLFPSQAPAAPQPAQDVLQPVLQALASAFSPVSSSPSSMQVNRQANPSDSLHSLLHPTSVQTAQQGVYGTFQPAVPPNDPTDSFQQISSLFASALASTAQPSEAPLSPAIRHENQASTASTSTQQLAELLGALASSEQSQTHSQAQEPQPSPMDALNVLMNQLRKNN